MKKYIITLGVLPLLILGAQSCNKTTSTEVKYNPNVSDLMTSNCTTCHSGSQPEAGLDLSTYANVKEATENGNLVSRMQDLNNPMPPSGKLSDTKIAIITDWIAGGYK